MKKKNSGQFKKGQHWRKARPWWERAWLVEQYESLSRSAADIAREGCVTENAILFWLKKHSIKTRTMQEIRNAKHWGASGVDNPMWNRRGELNPNWKGGVTAERQAFYASMEWKKVCSRVWKRDKSKCRRCGMKRDDSLDMPFHIHHIESFSVKGKRADPENLVLLCEVCHHFVHSRENIGREYLPQIRDS